MKGFQHTPSFWLLVWFLPPFKNIVIITGFHLSSLKNCCNSVSTRREPQQGKGGCDSPRLTAALRQAQEAV